MRIALDLMKENNFKKLNDLHIFFKLILKLMVMHLLKGHNWWGTAHELSNPNRIYVKTNNGDK